MRGHVRRRGGGWVFVVDLGRDPETGKRRQRWSRSYPTRKEAELEMRKALGRVDAGGDPFPERITVSAYLERWLAHLEVQDKPRRTTRHEYARLTRTRIIPAIGGHELAKIRPAHCQAVIDTATAEGVKPGQLRACMSSAFETALRWGLIATNPVRATTAPSRARPALRVPNAGEVRQLVEAARGTPWEIPVLISAVTGARRAEVLGLEWRATDLERGRVRVDRTLQRIDGELVFVPPKTEKSRREIPIPGWVVERLRAHKIAQARRRLELGAWTEHDLVCERGDGTPCDPDSFTHGFARIAKQAGLNGVRLHDLRHSLATELARAGTPPYVTSKILGHSSPTFTASVYQHADEESVDRALAGLEIAFGERGTGP